MEKSKSNAVLFKIFSKILYNFKSYFSFTVTTKYWLYSLCCTIHPLGYLIPSSLYLLLPHPYITPPCLPLVTTSLFSTSVSLLLFLFTSLLYFLDSPYKYHTVFVFLCHLSMIISRPIHVATNGIISFLFMAEE